jgi:predicted HAD superfamily Cof-like phosphohydrolase
MSTNWQQDILELTQLYGQVVNTSPQIPDKATHQFRRDLIEEEVNKELLPALDTDNLEEIADGIVDSIVVLLGTAIAYGIDIQPLWDIIHKSNMAKTDGGRREDGKVLKPEGWKPPDIARELRRQKALDTYVNDYCPRGRQGLTRDNCVNCEYTNCEYWMEDKK